MIKIIFVENNEIKMSKEEFEKLLEETYKRGKDENYEAAYNKGFKDGYCRDRYWYGGGISCTTTTSTNGPTITYLNSTGVDNAHSNPWQDHITYCDATTKTGDTATVAQPDLTSIKGYYAEPLRPEDYVE